MATQPTPEQLDAARRAFGWPMTVLELLADPVRGRLLTARAKALANGSKTAPARAGGAPATPLPWRRSGAAFDPKLAAANDRED